MLLCLDNMRIVTFGWRETHPEKYFGNIFYTFSHFTDYKFLVVQLFHTNKKLN